MLSIIQHKIGLTPAQSSARLSATPIPDGAAFSVIATGSTSQSAVSLANTAAAAMVTYEAAANSSASTTSSNTAAIFNEYRGQSTQLAHDKAIVQKLQNNSSSNGSSPDPTNPALVQAQANAGLAQGRANALAAAYTQALENRQPPGTMLSPLASALTASSDRKHKLELFAFVGLAAGLLIGSAIAVMLEQRRVRLDRWSIERDG